MLIGIEYKLLSQLKGRANKAKQAKKAAIDKAKVTDTLKLIRQGRDI